MTESPHYAILNIIYSLEQCINFFSCTMYIVQLIHTFSVLPGTYRQKKDHVEHNHNMEVCNPHTASPKILRKIIVLQCVKNDYLTSFTNFLYQLESELFQ